MSKRPVLLHIPHSSILIPPSELADYVVSEAELAVENLKLADLYTDELYNLEGAARLVFPCSRFMVDVERFSDDTAEPMAARGMGALYTAGTDLQPIRVFQTEQRRQELMAQYYWPHHYALDEMTADILAEYGKALIVDCHSYPSKPLPYELENQVLSRPPIGIGTDGFHTSPVLAQAAISAFKGRGYEVGINTPFAGSLVPNAFYGQESRVQSFMIEIRKDLYMNEATGEKAADFHKIQADIAAVLEEVSRFFITMAE